MSNNPAKSESSSSSNSSSSSSNSNSSNMVATASTIVSSLDAQTDGKYPSCSALFDRMWHCGNPSGQLSNAWKYGDIENCAPW